jgi:hypothetical protein
MTMTRGAKASLVAVISGLASALLLRTYKEAFQVSFENPAPPWWAVPVLWLSLSVLVPALAPPLTRSVRPVACALVAITISLAVVLWLDSVDYIRYVQIFSLAKVAWAVALDALLYIGATVTLAASATWCVKRWSSNPSLERP